MKLKTLLFILIALPFFNTLKAQTFGIGTDVPDSHAILELKSTSLGFLMTRLTTAQRNANILGLTGAQEGLLIYNTTDDNFNYWDGTQWLSFPGGLDHDWYEANTTTPPDNIADNIFTNGFVGIGINNPTQSLHIANTSAAIQSIRVQDLATGGNAYNPSLATVARNNRASVIVDKTNGLMYAVDADDIFWRLDGNAGINNAGYTGSCPNLISTSMNASSYDFIGTRDNTDFIFATNDRERMRILRDGQMVFYGKGITVPISSPTGCVPAYSTIDVASFYATGTIYPLNAYSEGAPAIYGSALYNGAGNAVGVQGYVEGAGSGTEGIADWFTATGGSIGVYAEESSLTGWALYVDGDAGITGTAYGFSDKSLKKDIKEYDKGLEVIMQLRPKEYQFKDEYSSYGLPKGERIGFIAQEVQNVLPSFVKSTNLLAPKAKKGTVQTKANVNNVLAMNYEGLIPILTSAVQEQQKEIEEIRTQLSMPQINTQTNYVFGTVTLNAAGRAYVSLSSNFTNNFDEFSYQLTTIGTPNQAYVFSEVNNNKFQIAGKPNSKVSWVVYGY